MSDIRESIKCIDEIEKSIGEILIEFYDTMKSLETDKNRGGLQATKIVMTISDLKFSIENLITKEYKPKKTKMAEEEKQPTMTIVEDHQELELVANFDENESFEVSKGKGTGFNLNFIPGTKVVFIEPVTGKKLTLICRIKS